MFVTLTVPQLACLSYFPASDVLLEWSAWSVLRPKCSAEVVHAWESQYLPGGGSTQTLRLASKCSLGLNIHVHARVLKERSKVFQASAM